MTIQGLVFSARLTKPVYRVGERVTTVFQLRNTTDRVRSWESIDFGWVVPDSDSEPGFLYGLTHPYGRRGPSLVLGPRETTTTTLWLVQQRPARFTIVPTFRGYGGDTPTGSAPPLQVEVR